MKRIIQRNLNLSLVYTLEGISYISILDGNGTCCENCGKPISNIAHLKSEGKSYYVGLDCMDTLLEQSKNILSSDDIFKYNWVYKSAIQKAKSTRSKILKLRKKYPTLKVNFVEFEDSFGFSYEAPDEKTGYTNPLGWDYTYNNEFKELTLNYIKDLL